MSENSEVENCSLDTGTEFASGRVISDREGGVNVMSVNLRAQI